MKAFYFLLILLALTGCDSDTTTENSQHYAKISISSQEEWNSEIINYATAGDVPILFYRPEERKSPPLIIALHHQSAAKEVWLNSLEAILKFAIESKTAFLACDLYGHGEWQVEGFNPALIDESNLESFMKPNSAGVTEAVRSFCFNQNISPDSLHYAAVSLGCFTAIDLAARGLKPRTMALVAPAPLKNADSPYSFHNNLEATEGVTLLAITGSDDEYNEPGEVTWWMDQVNSENKKVITYAGGHVPPLNVIDSCVLFFQEQLD